MQYIRMPALCAVGIFIALQGCAFSIVTGDGTKRRMTTAELREYARYVFEYHNKTISDLMLAYPGMPIGNEARLSELYAAEEKMLIACEELNEVAVLYRDKGKAALNEKIQVPRSLGKCEAETRRVENLLDSLLPTAPAEPVQ